MSLLGTRYVPLPDASLHSYANGVGLNARTRGRVSNYLNGALRDFRQSAGQGHPSAHSVEQTADAVFKLLTSRPYCYLSRSQSGAYRAATMAHLQRDIERGEPVRFFFDIGPGYHASMAPGFHDLGYHVGFSELMLLRQIARFRSAIAPIYAPGAVFTLVVDNLCGLATNDIRVDRTSAYVSGLRALISTLGQAATVDLLVESETTDWPTYRSMLDCAPVTDDTNPATLSSDDIENVGRFLGHPVSPVEAARRIDRYQRATWVTEELLKEQICGVRLTQRHTANTLCFRSFPGGAQRMQVGELALVGLDHDTPRPVLITSHNAGSYRLGYVGLPEILPSPMKTLLIGEAVVD